MNKTILLIFVGLCLGSFIHANIIKDAADDAVYAAVKILLLRDHQPEETDCMVDDMRRNKVADKLYSLDLITNQEKLAREVKPYVDEAQLKCQLITFFKSPLGICVLIALFILALSIICGLIRCICC